MSNTNNTGTAANIPAVNDAKKARPATGKPAEKKASETPLKADVKAAEISAITERKLQAEKLRQDEKAAVKAAIKLLPVIELPICTQSGKPAINADGKQMFFSLPLSGIFSGIGKQIDLNGNADMNVYFNGHICTLKGKGNAGNRCKDFILALTAAAAAKVEDEKSQQVILSLRAKYDFPVQDEAGKFAATLHEVERAITLHTSANNTVKRLLNVNVDNFGFNPEKRQIVKAGREVFKAIREENISEASKLLSAFDREQAMKLLS